MKGPGFGPAAGLEVEQRIPAHDGIARPDQGGIHRQARRLVQAIAEPAGLPRHVCAGGAEADGALAEASNQRVVVAQEGGERAQGRPAGDVDERDAVTPGRARR